MISLPEIRSAADWIKTLGMTPSGVGGWFAPAMASNETISGARLPPRFLSDHVLYSSNWYMLQPGEVLRLHCLKQDELWFFHTGSPIRLHIFPPTGSYSTILLGDDPRAGQVLHSAAPHSTWFGAEPGGPEYALVSCSLSPGYNAADSSNPTMDDIQNLIAAFPPKQRIIQRLTAGAFD